MKPCTVIHAAFLCAALFIAGAAHAEPSVLTQLLQTALRDVTLAPEQEKIEYLRAASGNTPFLERVEVRLRADQRECDQNRERYGMRFYPVGPGAATAGTKAWQASILSAEAGRNLAVHRALCDRYLVAIELAHSRQLADLKQKLAAVYADMAAVHANSMGTEGFDPQDPLQTEQNRIRARMDQIENESRSVVAETRARRYLGVSGPVLIEPDQLIRFDSLAQVADTVTVTGDPGLDNVYLAERWHQTDLARHRFELQKADSRKIINFVEAAWEDGARERQHDYQNVFLFSLGIRLPFVGNDRLDVSRARVQFLDAQARAVRERAELGERLTATEATLKQLLHQHEIAAHSPIVVDAHHTLQACRHTEGTSPLVMLRLRERVLRHEIELAIVSREAYTAYIALLDLSGRLSERPLRNYLSDTLEVLQP